MTRERPAWFLLACAALLFSPFWLLGQVFVPGDFLGFIYPWRDQGLPPPHNLELFDCAVFFYPQDVFLNSRLKAGDLPLWNPHIFCGHPMVASGQSALLYPPRLLAHVVFSPAVARTLIIALHVTLDGLLMYLWLRGRGLLPWAACVGGLAWMLNGQVASWMEFEHLPVIAAWLPLMLWSLDRALEGRWRCWGLLAVAGALSLSGGHLQYNLYSGLVVGVYCGIRVRGWRACLALGVAGGLSLLLAAPTLLPFQELLAQSQRAAFTPQQIRDTMAPTLSSLLATLVCPDIWGNPARGFMINRVPTNLIYPEFACFGGLVPLLLALLAGVRGARGQALWPRLEVAAWSALALLSLLFAAATPAYDLALTLVPKLNILIPSRILLAFHFALASLAALGAHCWLTQGPPAGVRASAGLLAGLWLTLLGWIHWRLATDPTWALGWPIKIPPLDTGKAAILAAARANYSSLQMFLPALILAVLAGLGPRRWGGALAGLAALDTLLFASVFNTTVAPSSLFPPTPQTRYLQEHAGLQRVEKLQAAFYNTLVPYGVHLLSGYESMFPRRVYRTLSAAEPGASLSMRSLSLQRFESPLLQGFALRYLLQHPLRPAPGGAWRPLGQGLYENPKALARAFVVGEFKVFADPEAVYAALAAPEFDPARWAALEGQPSGPVEPDSAGSPARILEYLPERVVVEVEMRGAGLLILSDTYYPGWEATVDGLAASIMVANGCCRAVRLESGRHRVVFTYRPASLRLGGAACLLGVVLLGMGGLVSLGVRGSRRSAPP